MKAWLQFFGRGLRMLVGWVFSFALWAVWLALAVLLGFQIYILTAKELAIPDFALRQLEDRLAESGLRATFSRTSFDPTGRVLIENVRLMLPAFTEPVATIGSVYVHLDPLYLLVGRVEPSEIRIVRAQAGVPAMLSPSGRQEEIIRDLDALIEPVGRTLVVRQLTTNLAGVKVAAHGTIPLPRRSEKKPSGAMAEFLARRFPELCKQAIVARDMISRLEEPSVDLDFAPSEGGSISIGVSVLARALTLTQPFPLEADQVRATTRLLLFGDAPASHVELCAREVRVAGDARIGGVNAIVYGRLQINRGQFELREAIVTADTVAVAGADATAVSAQLFPRPLPRLDAAITAKILGSPLGLRAEADLGERTAFVRFDGVISPRVLDVISARVGTDVRKFYDFRTITAQRGEARFGAGWKFEKLTAQVRVPWMNSYGVVMEDGRAAVELEPHRFFSPEAFARVGDNFARGFYEHNLKTHEYRFLLEGRLRPLAISPWFREWWPNFFQQLEFVTAPPEASVDVAGSWRDSRHSTVFVFADAAKSIVRGTELDHVRTRLFIRPTFFDGLELLATRGEGDAHGRFTLVSDPVTHDWQTLELSLDSTLDLKVPAQLLGPAGAKILGQFQLAAAPELKVRGTFAGPAAPKTTQDKLRIEARTAGEFRFHNFPLQDLSFVATLDGDEVVLDDVEAMFADGVASGHARVWNVGNQRRLGFDFSLQDATLGSLAGTLQDFFAAQKGQASPPPGKFVKEKASVRFDFAASAEGSYSDPFSFRGDGNVALHGAEIGEVPLLGALSELLKFTALRFTEARANFKIEGTKIAFPKVEVRGANSVIDAHGEYALDKRLLDFNAKLFPFQESESLLKSVVGAVLTPLSNAFEVKLSGSLEKPEWAFVRGPTNFLRSLGEGGDSAEKTVPAAEAKSPASAKP